jgi:hypothetical protein
MPILQQVDILNRVLAILQRSYPQYMCYGRPYVPAGREGVMASIQDIVASQDAVSLRLTDAIMASDGRPDPGDFPIEYTDTHDLAIDFLIREAISSQKQDIADLQKYVDALRTEPAAQSLVAEALGMSKAHLEVLEDLKRKAPSPSTIIRDSAAAFANDMPVANEATGTPHRQEERKLAAGDPKTPG